MLLTVLSLPAMWSRAVESLYSWLVTTQWLSNFTWCHMNIPSSLFPLLCRGRWQSNRKYKIHRFPTFLWYFPYASASRHRTHAKDRLCEPRWLTTSTNEGSQANQIVALDVWRINSKLRVCCCCNKRNQFHFAYFESCFLI